MAHKKSKYVKEDIKFVHESLKKLLEQRYKRTRWEKFKDAITNISIGGLLLISIIFTFTLGIFLIKNPISLAILCGSILLAIMWGSR